MITYKKRLTFFDIRKSPCHYTDSISNSFIKKQTDGKYIFLIEV